MDFGERESSLKMAGSEGSGGRKRGWTSGIVQGEHGGWRRKSAGAVDGNLARGTELTRDAGGGIGGRDKFDKRVQDSEVDR